MSILSVCSAVLITSVLCILLKKYNAEYSLILTLGVVCLVSISLLSEIAFTITGFKDLIETSGVNQDYIKILLKCIGICFLTEFTCDVCIDASQKALSSLVLMSGRVCTLLAALPLFSEFIDISLSLSGGNM